VTASGAADGCFLSVLTVALASWLSLSYRKEKKCVEPSSDIVVINNTIFLIVIDGNFEVTIIYNFYYSTST